MLSQSQYDLLTPPTARLRYLKLAERHVNNALRQQSPNIGAARVSVRCRYVRQSQPILPLITTALIVLAAAAAVDSLSKTSTHQRCSARFPKL
jgi:hypothetical protein